MNQCHRGFTLIELLIVIGIISLLAVGVVLTLNPAQLLRQARDSTRLSDLSAVRSAMSLYLGEVDPSATDLGDSRNCYVHTEGSSGGWTTGLGCSGRFVGDLGEGGANNGGTNTEVSSVSNNGTGWIPVNFTLVTAGAPLSSLPVDPLNDESYFYAYRASNATPPCGGISADECDRYEVNADMESGKFSSGSTNVEDSDGGDTATLYEIGTFPGLDL